MTVIEVDHKQRPQLEAFNPSVRHAKIISNLQTTTYGMNLSEAHTHLPIKQLSCQILNGFSSMRSIGSARRRDSRGLQRAGTADRTLCNNGPRYDLSPGMSRIWPQYAVAGAGLQ